MENEAAVKIAAALLGDMFRSVDCVVREIDAKKTTNDLIKAAGDPMNPEVLLCLGDMLLALGTANETHRLDTESIAHVVSLCEAAMLSGDQSTQEAALELLTGLFQGCRENRDLVSFLISHVESVVVGMGKLATDDNVTKQLIGLVGDMAHTDPRLQSLLKTQSWIGQLFERCEGSGDPEIAEVVQWAREQLRR